MQYNSEANGQDIVTMSEKLSKSNSTSFPISEKTLYANQALKKIVSWIHDAYGGWMYDDNNNLDFPEATAQLNSGQVDYSLPTEDSKVHGVSIRNNNSGSWYPLAPITLEQIQDHASETEFYSTASQPRYYRLLAKSIKIYPAANYTQASSIKIYESRDSTTFDTTDTTQEPGFDEQYHEAVPTYMALQYAKINQLANKNDLEADWLRYEQQIKKDYSQRFAEMFPPRITVRDFTRESQ